MKRFWSLIIAVVMLFTVFALVSCEGKTEPTSEPTTQAPTTAAPTTAAPTTAAPTTAAPTTAAPTTAAPTTAAPTTAEPTTAEPTTAEPTTEPTTAETTEATTTEETTKATGTTLPLYARLDFGTESYAVQNGLTAHEYLMGILSYSKSNLFIDVKEDSWKIWVMSDFPRKDDGTPDYDAEGFNSNAYALTFDSVITYDYEFPDEGMFPGWGTWSKYPYTTANVGKSWVGRHQYMRIRLINNTSNNMIGMGWSASNSPGYFTTLQCSNLYLQGTVGSKTCTPTEKYETYTYDLALTNALCSNRFGWGSGKVWIGDEQLGQADWCTTATFAQFTAAAKDPRNIGCIGANNYNAAAAEVTGLRFFLFGAVDNRGGGDNNPDNVNCDCRENAKQGTYVEVDYIIFGSSLEQLDSYKSNLERAGK